MALTDITIKLDTSSINEISEHIEAALTDLRAENERLNSELAEVERISVLLRNEIDMLNGRIEQKDKTITEFKNSRDYYASEVIRHRRELARRPIDACLVHEHKIKQMQAQIDECESLRKQLADANESVRTLRRHMSDAEGASVILKNEIERLQMIRQCDNSKILDGVKSKIDEASRSLHEEIIRRLFGGST